jgi:hypothetical protein
MSGLLGAIAQCHCPATPRGSHCTSPAQEKPQIQKSKYDWELVAHACNPSYSGGRDQEDHSSKPVLANSSGDPISKIFNTEKGWWSGSRLGHEFKPQYHT